jgi:translation elongation factor EF-Ts
MKHIKKFEKETDEVWNKIVNNDIDKSSDEFKNLISQQFEIDDKYQKDQIMKTYKKEASDYLIFKTANKYNI